MNYDEFVGVMVEFIAFHPISILLTKIPNVIFHVRLFFNAFERVKIDEAVVECMITDECIVSVRNITYLHASRVSPNPKGFKVFELKADEFQDFLTQMCIRRY